jgi:hypothetical protein
MTSDDLQLPGPNHPAPTILPLNQIAALYEKSSSSVSTENRRVYLDSEKASSSASNPSAYSDTALLKGEPIVTNGEDVSRFVVDIRDDGESALTFRSIFLGTVFAGLGAALSQVFACFYVTEFGFDLVGSVQIYVFKPLQVSVSTVFMLLLIYTFGVAWATILPQQSWTERTRFQRFGPLVHFINPGEFRLKEVYICLCLFYRNDFNHKFSEARRCQSRCLHCIRFKCRCTKFCCPKSKPVLEPARLVIDRWVVAVLQYTRWGDHGRPCYFLNSLFWVSFSLPLTLLK